MTTGALNREQGVIEIFSNAIRIYQNNYLVLVPLALMAVPVGVANDYVSKSIGPIETALVFWFVGPLLATPYVAGMIHVVAQSRTGQAATLPEVSRVVARRLAALLTTELWATVMGTATIFAFPYFLVRWRFTTQAVMLDGASNSAALSASADAVRGRWWRTAFVLMIVIVCQLVLAISTLIIARSASPPDALIWSTVSALATAIWIPLAVGVETVLYFDLKARLATEMLWNSTS